MSDSDSSEEKKFTLKKKATLVESSEEETPKKSNKIRSKRVETSDDEDMPVRRNRGKRVDTSDEDTPVKITRSKRVETSDDEDFKIRTGLQALPKVILDKISTYMGSADTLNTFGVTSLMTTMKYNLPLNLADVPLTVEQLYAYRKQLTPYKIIGLNLVLEKYTTLKPYIVKLLNKITTLVLNQKSKHTLLAEEILENCASLTILTIKSGIKSILLPNTLVKLTSFSVEGGREDQKISNLPELRKLTVLDIINFDLYLNNLPSLIHLETDAGNVVKLEECKNLQTLIIKSSQNQDFSFISQLKSLVHVDISSQISMTTFSLAGNETLQHVSISNYGELKKVDLSQCINLIHVSITRIKADTPQLELSLTGCRKLIYLKIENLKLKYNYSSSDDEKGNHKRKSKVSSSDDEKGNHKRKSKVSNSDDEQEDYRNESESSSEEEKKFVNSPLSKGKMDYLEDLVSLKELILKSDPELNIDFKYFRKCSSLESLTLSCSSRDTSFSSISSLSKCTKLRIVSFRDCFSLDNISALNLPHLDSLDLTGTSVHNIKSLTKCSNLKWLILPGYVIDLYPLRNCTQLNYLKATTNNLDEISNLTSLRRLNVNCDKLKNLKDLAKCINLIKLSVTSEQLTTVEGIENCTKCIEVIFHNCPKLDNITSLGNCPQLFRIELTNTGVTNVKPLARCPLLTYLIIDNGNANLRVLDNLYILEIEEV
jgi:hypothetical protein